MTHTLFFFNKLNTWDKVTILFYIILSFGLWYYFDNTTLSENKRNILFFYSLGTQLFLIFFNYKSLRNLTVYFFWIAVGFIHLYIYFQQKYDPNLNFARGHSTTGLKNTIILLFLFQVLRILSIKVQKKELVNPARSNPKDLFGERSVTFIDFILFAIYYGLTIFLLNFE